MSEAKPTEGQDKQAIKRPISWALWGLLAILVIFLASAFARAWQTHQALKAELSTLELMATTARQEQAKLEARLAYVQSDEYVEAWSQSKAAMTRPGETLIVVMSPTPTPLPALEVVETPEPLPTSEPFWSRLWTSLAGQ
jgi:cell division protein FtsB